MKYVIIIVFFILTSCQKKETFNNVLILDETDKSKKTKNFKKINYSVRYNYRDSLAKHLNPNKKYQYWQYATFYHGMDDKTEHTILKQGGDLSLRKKIIEKFNPEYSVGIFQGGHPSFRCNYVTTIYNEKISYLKTEEEFRDFLGTIDNLEEAMLLAHTYGYLLDNDIRGSEYRKVENGYILHLVKFHEYPIYKESVEITVNTDGFIKTKSLGIYCEGANCYQ